MHQSPPSVAERKYREKVQSEWGGRAERKCRVSEGGTGRLVRDRQREVQRERDGEVEPWRAGEWRAGGSNVWICLGF